MITFNINQGFTLIETMISLVIMAILLVIAAPLLIQTIQNNKMLTQTNTFVSALQLARSQAMSRQTYVVMCAASDATQTQCGSNHDWSNGWIVFVDSDGNQSINQASDIIHVSDVMEPGTNVTSVSGHIVFTGIGFVTSGHVSYTMVVPDCAGNDAGRTVNLSASGRTDIATYSCGI